MDKTLIEAARLISLSKSIVLTTHELPDGDGLGAEIALYHYLGRLGKNVRILNPDDLPQRYRFLDKTGAIETYPVTRSQDDAFDLGIVVDTADPRRLGKVWERFRRQGCDVLFFDHHPHQEGAELSPEFRDLKVHRVIDVKSSSIGELLYRFFHFAHDLLDPSTASFRLSPEIATGLYVSVMTDTNSFRYARTTALSHRIAADLIDFGLQPEEIYQSVYSSKSVAHLHLIGEVLSRVDEQGNIAWAEIPRSLRQKYGATGDDTQTIINFMLLLKDAEVLILLREEDDGRLKVSLKSKGTVTVNDVAHDFGGGGHQFAAGFVTAGTMEDIRKRLLERFSGSVQGSGS